MKIELYSEPIKYLWGYHLLNRERSGNKTWRSRDFTPV